MPHPRPLGGGRNYAASISLSVLVVCAALFAAGEGRATDPRVAHPERYIRIHDWHMYFSWGAVAIIHHVTIENTSDIPYKDPVVRVRYYSTHYTSYGKHIGNTQGVLRITLPPKSKATYLKGGAPLGAGGSLMIPGAIEVLGATPIATPIKE